MANQLYQSQVGAPGAGGFASPAGVPTVSSAGNTAAAFGALADIGALAKGFGDRMAAAKAKSLDVEAMTGYMTDLDAIEQKFATDADPGTAPTRFAEEQKALEMRWLGTLGNAEREARLPSFRRLGLMALGKVQSRTTRMTVERTIAGFEGQEAAFARRLAGASPAERATIMGEYEGSVRGLVDQGFIGADDAGRRVRRFRGDVDRIDVMRRMETDPAGAVAAFDDPAAFPDLDPLERQRLKEQAGAAADARRRLEIEFTAGIDPARAAAMTGFVSTGADLDAVMRKGLVPQESGGDPNALSPKGAAGIAQVMPGTARLMAGKLGLSEIAGLSDGEIQDRLRADPALSYRLGREYMAEGLASYNGNIWGALARYNAGPGDGDTPRGDAWHAAAVARFGPAYTAGQLASLIPIAETRDYVLSIAGRLGIDPNAPGMSPSDAWQASSSVMAELRRQQAETDRLAKELAAMQREDGSPGAFFEDGYAPDPQALADYRRTQQAAAEAGDRAAAKALRDLDFHEEMAPVVAAAYRQPPAALEGEIAALRDEVTTGGRPEDRRRLDVLEKVADEVTTLARDNPIELGERARLYRPVAIDPAADFSGRDMQAALAGRAVQAETAARAYGLATPQVFKPAEREALKERFSAAPAAERRQMVAGLAKALPLPAYQAAVGEIAGDDRVALVAGLVGRDRPEVAGEIFRGTEMLQSGKAAKPKAEMVRAARADGGGSIYPSPEMEQAVNDAAVAVYAARRGAAGLFYEKPEEDAMFADAFGKALESVTGPMLERHGKRFPVPPGLQPGMVDDALDRLTDDEVGIFG
ncbi:MAG TPA: transglycosylase SLT domain-containing protein, partial [Hyphomicrobiales bacterium]|nr:transglycosylase SLT domain-containing protein [Hyphomicrobiales bacterium]